MMKNSDPVIVKFLVDSLVAAASGQPVSSEAVEEFPAFMEYGAKKKVVLTEIGRFALYTYRPEFKEVTLPLSNTLGAGNLGMHTLLPEQVKEIIGQFPAHPKADDIIDLHAIVRRSNNSELRQFLTMQTEKFFPKR